MRYDEPGTYEITLRAVDGCGNEATATREVTVVDSGELWINSINVTDYTAPNATPTPLEHSWYQPDELEYELIAENVTCEMRNGDIIPYTDLPRALDPMDVETGADEEMMLVIGYSEGGDNQDIYFTSDGDTFTCVLRMDNAPYTDIVSVHFDKLTLRHRIR